MTKQTSIPGANLPDVEDLAEQFRATEEAIAELQAERRDLWRRLAAAVAAHLEAGTIRRHAGDDAEDDGESPVPVYRYLGDEGGADESFEIVYGTKTVCKIVKAKRRG